jgi:hypothetical protein
MMVLQRWWWWRLKVFWDKAQCRFSIKKVADVLEELVDSIFRVKESKKNWLCLWKWRQQALSKRQSLFTQWHSVIYHRTCIFTKYRQECWFPGWNSNRSFPAYESERYCLCQHTLNVVRDGRESLFHLWIYSCDMWLFKSRYYISISHFRFLNKWIALKLVTQYTVHWSEKLKGRDS